MYTPQTQPPWALDNDPKGEVLYGVRTIVVRADRPAAVAPELRGAVTRLDPRVPITRLQTMDHLVADSMAHPRFCMVLFTLFGGVALVLATVGVYGLTAYSVSQRSHELAIRTALGARPASVIGLVLRTGIRLAEIGIGVGLAGVLAVGRLLRALLFDVSPADPLTLSAAALLLGAVALAASWIPARRATGVAPLIALRQE